MTAPPRVTVVTIFLDEERFLAEAIESVLAQTYPRWELLLVDDGSTDGSGTLAREYARRHPERIRYLEHPGHQNRGMSASRNLGIREARGEYLTFLDADDVFLPEKLEEQVEILEAHPTAAMTYGQALVWHSWTGRPGDRGRDHRYKLGVRPGTLVQPPALFLLLLDNRFQSPMTGNAMLRREVALRVGGFEESFRGMYEDQAFFLKVNLTWPAFVTDRCWLKYRQHPGSCSARSAGVSYFAGRRPLLEWLSGYLAAEGAEAGSEIDRAVRRELRAARHPRLATLRAGVRSLLRRLHAGSDTSPIEAAQP
jgi:glycosyltransferase involved in cell wall biosynthesis